MVRYDVLVVGGGHAGCEAALAASRLGCQTLLLTMNLDTIGFMSCNPSIGGLGKGQLVKEIDALGGEMAKAIDHTAIQIRLLNTTKGPAVRSSRAQADRQAYRLYMKSVLESQPGLHLRQGEVKELIVERGKVKGVRTTWEETFLARCAVITPGTFLDGLIHIGFHHFPGGRMGELASRELSANLRNLGFKIGRFKTGTCPRLDGRTLDFSRLEVQKGEDDIPPFSFATEKPLTSLLPCYLTYTNPRTHQVIRNSLDRSPLYSGVIKGRGVRYCPSIEDKVVKFPDKERHQIFLEPEGKNTREFYPNGLSTSLPLEVQIEMLRTIEGLEEVEITRPGYAIEHDYAHPTQLNPTLETKPVENLFFAGQINGTTGYEEAACQGLIAGINAALKAKNKPPLILDRSQAYIGVLIDDLVTKGTNEPYRIFTSRAEYRLLLREDNADLRLREIGYRVGLVSKEEYEKCQEKKELIEKELKRLKRIFLPSSPKVNKKLTQLGSSPLEESISLEKLLRRPEISYPDLASFAPHISTVPRDVAQQVEIEVKYAGYIRRQEMEIKKFNRLEGVKIPPNFDFSSIKGLSTEVREKLSQIRPLSLGQASRISGVTPAAITILMIHLEKMRRNGGKLPNTKRTGSK